MNQKNYELLHWAVTQHQFVKSFDPNNAKECYDKVYNSYKRLYDKVVNYCVLNEETAQETIKTSPVDNSESPIKKTSQNELEISEFRKEGSSKSTKNKEWRNYRNEKVIELYKECIRKQQPITDDIIFRIAQIVGTNSPKVKQIINDYEFSQI